ncbi:DNA adenine methylase [Patescibacteria group bacterium]|nr:DNA adenine methylase [Patescibacteria group bacterium]
MRFIGCKENLLGFIETFVKQKDIRGNTFCDLFAGTGSVAKHFKKLGYKIISSDLLYFSYVLQKVYIEQNQYPKFAKLLKHLKINPVEETLFISDSQSAKEIIKYLNNLEGVEGFIYKNYSPEGTQGQTNPRKYFTGDNAKRIDAIREKIEEWKKSNLLNEQEYFFLLGALIEAVPFVANISGTYSAFLKEWDKRAFKKLTLKVPEIIKSDETHKVFNINGLNVFDRIKGIDILYLDPPYNERQYAPNYHILETIAKWDKPKIKGITGMRTYEDQKSEFCNSKSGIKALGEIIKKSDFKHLILSYNDDGIMPENEILKLFNNAGKTEVAEQDYQRYKSNSNGDQKNGVREKLYYLKSINQNNKLNDLSGSEWIYFLNSVDVTHYSTKGADGFAHYLRGKHPSPKPPQLMKKFVDFFTKENQVVLDPFMGVGGTLIACSLSNRKGIGVDLSKEYIDLYKKVCKELNVAEQTAIIGNSAGIDKLLKQGTTVDFILTDPPYGEMLSNKRTGQRKKKTGIAVATPFTNHETDLGNMERENFLESLKEIIAKSAEYLKPKGYIAVFVKDLQPKNGEHNMLHAFIADKLLEIPDISFRGYKIWYDATQKLYPFGYPHAFVANQFHQFVMIFRKEK